MHIAGEKRDELGGQHEPINRFYFGILPTVLSMVYFLGFAEALAEFLADLDVGCHGGRYQDARLIRDVNRKYEQTPSAADYARRGGHAARGDWPQIMNRQICRGDSFIQIDLG